MYLLRFSIAILLGFVWYLFDRGQVAAQIVLCLLFWQSTPNVFIKTRRESGTQTYDVAEEDVFQETTDHLGCDVTDTTSTKAETSQEAQFPHVKRSLQQVFECAYTQLVLPWYSVPEPCDSQLLHQVLWREFDQVIDQVISRSKDFNVCAASVGCIRILTQHLHNAKQSHRKPLFRSRGEEVEVLRVFSEALVRNLFPQSLWGLAVSHCALNEIVALKVLDLLVLWLSDPDNLNQLVVSLLDGATPKSSVEELCESHSDRASPASLESQASGATQEETEDAQTSDSKCKKKANKLKEGWSKFLEKMRLKIAKREKMKKREQALVVGAMSVQGRPSNENEGSSQEGSIQNQQDSDSEDCDLESYLNSVQEDMMEFKLSYELWRVGHWAVSVPCVERENEELCFTVHLEERDNPENLHWNVRKTQTDIIHFRNLWQDSANLPSLSVLEESTEMNINEDFKEARKSIKLFLQELVSDVLVGHTQPVFQFLCPLDKLLIEEDHVGDVWGLFSGLAYFLTPAQEEDEDKHNSLGRGTKPDDSKNTTEAADPTATENLDGDTRDDLAQGPCIIISQCDQDSPSEPSSIECCRDDETKPIETSDILVDADKTEESENHITSHLKMAVKGLSRSEECLAQTKSDTPEDQTDSFCRLRHSSENGGLQFDLTDSPSHPFIGKSNKKEKLTFKMSGGIPRSKGNEMGSQSKLEDSPCLKKEQSSWEQMEATKALFDLLKAISGNSILLNIFDAILKPVMPILKKKVNSFLNNMNPTEAQIASYIDNLREKQWPEGLLEVTCPIPHRSSEEKHKTKDRAHHLINARYSNYLILKKTDMETAFKLFQDCEENKKLVYMLLSFLLRELLPGEDALNVSALQKVNVN